MTLTIKLDGGWNCLLSAKNKPPIIVTGNVIVPSARMNLFAGLVMFEHKWKYSLFGVVRAIMNRVRISSMVNALETCTPRHDELKFAGIRQAPAENESVMLMCFFQWALIKH